MIIKQCWIDVETTGLDKQKSGIIQLSGFLRQIENGKIKHLENFNFLMQPFQGSIITDEALEKQHRTREDILTYEVNRVGYQLFLQLLGHYVKKFDRTDKFHFVGYNANFDADFIRAWFEKLGDTFFGSWFWYPIIDVCVLTGEELMEHRNELKNFQLGTVAEYLGIKADGQLHDAFTDIKLTEQIYREILVRRHERNSNISK